MANKNDRSINKRWETSWWFILLKALWSEFVEGFEDNLKTSLELSFSLLSGYLYPQILIFSLSVLFNSFLYLVHSLSRNWFLSIHQPLDAVSKQIVCYLHPCSLAIDIVIKSVTKIQI